jgi:hypothetical protein
MVLDGGEHFFPGSVALFAWDWSSFRPSVLSDVLPGELEDDALFRGASPVHDVAVWATLVWSARRARRSLGPALQAARRPRPLTTRRWSM